jgi:hypothetical protein
MGDTPRAEMGERRGSLGGALPRGRYLALRNVNVVNDITL